MPRRETMRARYRRLTDSLDELLVDYLDHHPEADVSGLLVTDLRDWASTDPVPRDPTDQGED